jgi:hypothetical protein
LPRALSKSIKTGSMKYLLIAGVVIVGMSVVGLMPAGREPAEPFPDAPARPVWPGADTHGRELRDEALRRARVWQPTPATIDLGANPPDVDGALSGDPVRCRFVSMPARGTTPKFDCVLATGERVTVKYGHTGEIPAELAASRLLTALGFAADRMYLVPRVRCYGCPRQPFYAVWLLDRLRARDVALGALPAGGYTDFAAVTVERRVPGVEVETADADGWAWYEIESLEAGRERSAIAEGAAASRAEWDALRLAAIFLAHWDNKAPNQRLVCTQFTPADRDGRRCQAAVAYLQDLGATFGPNKVDRRGWEQAPIWADASACRVSMRSFPYGGGTFRDVSISETGRRLLSDRLNALTREQVRSLFSAGRFKEFHGSGESADVEKWTDVFLAKAAAIAHAGPCPALSTGH